MQGQLIFPVLARIWQFCGAAVEDPDFMEPEWLEVAREGVGKKYASETGPYLIPCQVEPGDYEAMRLGAAGDDPHTQLDLIFHRRHLLRAGLIAQATGQALIKPRDRLSRLLSIRGEPLAVFCNPPGLFARESRPIGFGLNRGGTRANLLRVTFASRSMSVGGMA